MGILSGNPKHEPMHYGEVSVVWGALLANKGMYSVFQKFMNHAGDKELKQILAEMIETIKEESAQMEDLLKVNGIVPPPTPSEVPEANLEAIPVGARLTDQEIAASLSKESSLGMVACSTAMGQCIREDVGAMFAKFHTNSMRFSLRMLELNKTKGWLIPPPLHQEIREPAMV